MLEAVPEDGSARAAGPSSSAKPYRLRSTTSTSPTSSFRISQRSGRGSFAGSIPRITVQDWAESVTNLMLTEQAAVQNLEFIRFVQSPDATSFASAAYFYILIWKKTSALRSPAPIINNQRHCDLQPAPPKSWKEIWQENPKLKEELDDSLQVFAERYAILLLKYSRADPMQDRDFFDCLLDFTIRTLKIGFAAESDLFPFIHQELRRVLHSKSFMGRIESNHGTKPCIRERRRIRDSLKACSPLISAILHSTGLQTTPRTTASFIYGIVAGVDQQVELRICDDNARIVKV